MRRHSPSRPSTRERPAAPAASTCGTGTIASSFPTSTALSQSTPSNDDNNDLLLFIYKIRNY